jgi:hypothetical protein
MSNSVRTQWGLSTIAGCVCSGIVSHFLGDASAAFSVFAIAVMFAGFGVVGME